jgi:hypothetical protein
MSGFVLTLAILKSRESFAAYVAKRIVRIWVPFAIALLLAIAASEALFVQPIGDGYANGSGHATWRNFNQVRHGSFVNDGTDPTYDAVACNVVSCARDENIHRDASYSLGCSEISKGHGNYGFASLGARGNVA